MSHSFSSLWPYIIHDTTDCNRNKSISRFDGEMKTWGNWILYCGLIWITKKKWILSYSEVQKRVKQIQELIKIILSYTTFFADFWQTQQVFNRFIEKFHYFLREELSPRPVFHISFVTWKFLKFAAFANFAHKTRAERPFVLVSGPNRKSGLTYILPPEAAKHTFQLRFRLRLWLQYARFAVFYGRIILAAFCSEACWVPSAEKQNFMQIS